jgi:proline iminopeptidase
MTRHAEQMATPWFGINEDCFSAIRTELRRTWHEAELIDACRSFGVPVLIVTLAARRARLRGRKTIRR